MRMIFKKRLKSGRCWSIYAVVVDKNQTVSDFLNEIESQRDLCQGNIFVTSEERIDSAWTNSTIISTYRNNEVLKSNPILHLIENKKILKIEARCNGLFIDYLIRINDFSINPMTNRQASDIIKGLLIRSEKKLGKEDTKPINTATSLALWKAVVALENNGD